MDRRGTGAEERGWLWRRPAAALAELRDAAADLGGALAKSGDLEAARRIVRAWMEGRRWALLDGDEDGDEDGCLDVGRARAAVEALAGLCGRSHERRVGFSTLALLRRALRGDLEGLTAGFLLEFAALLRDARGSSCATWVGPVEPLEEAPGVALSERLDAVGAAVWRRINRYPTGLDNDMIQRRDVARRRILAAFGGSDDDWDDPRWHLDNLLGGAPADLDRLRALVSLRAAESQAVEAWVRAGEPLAITPFHLSLLDLEGNDPEVDDAIRARVLAPLRSASPARGGAGSPVAIVARRRPLVATLDVSGLARQRSLPGDTSQEDVDRALEWIAARTALAEVRVVGGDPLLLADAIIERIMGRLAAMPHVTQIRWATRTLVTLPMRITPALAGLLGRYHEPGQRSVVVLADVVSALEVTPELVEAAARLRCQGVDVHNHQRVGLPWSRRFEAVAARLALARAGVEARGRVLAAGEETPFARVLQERREEARLLPGRLRAEALLVDAPGPGGRGRVEAHDRELAAIRSDGRRVYLVGCSAEEGPRIHVDASIADYLDGLAARGEDPEDYASLWRHR